MPEGGTIEIVAVDIGGTHARFALANLGDQGIALGAETVFQTKGYSGLREAWQAFERLLGRPLPRAAGLAIAAPVGGDRIAMTNSDWVLRRADLHTELGVDRVTLVNDFAAVAYALAHCSEHLDPLCGPAVPLPAEGVISIVGPGTGLGVALLHRTAGVEHVIATEGGHIDFAPVDAVDDQLLASLRTSYGRVSIERIVSGPGLAAIAKALFPHQEAETDQKMWQRALSGDDPTAAAALDRFCMSLGSVAGDFALAHGANAVVIAGGLGLRLAGALPKSGFADRFVAKARYREFMATLPVLLLTHQQSGLLGAAAAFANEHRG